MEDERDGEAAGVLGRWRWGTGDRCINSGARVYELKNDLLQRSGIGGGLDGDSFDIRADQVYMPS